MRSPEDQEALDDAIVAIDAAINTLVVARMVILQRLEHEPHTAKPAPEPEPAAPAAEAGCAHESTFEVTTLAGSVLMCNDCGGTPHV